MAAALPMARRMPVPRVAAPWEAVPPPSASKSETKDPWSGLEIPEGRNHRFFVRSMDEFKAQLQPSDAK